MASFETGFPWFQMNFFDGGKTFWPFNSPYGGKAEGKADAAKVLNIHLVRIVATGKSNDVTGIITVKENDGTTEYFTIEYSVQSAVFIPEHIDLNIQLQAGISIHCTNNMQMIVVYRFLG